MNAAPDSRRLVQGPRPTAAEMPMGARITPFLAYIAILALTPAMMVGVDRIGIPALWLHPLNGVVAGLLLIYFWRYYNELRGSRPLGLFRTAGSLVAGIVIFILWITLDTPWMVWGAAPTFDPTNGEQTFGSVTAVRLASLVIVVPLMEELFWRSFLMRWLTDRDFTHVDPRRTSVFAFGATAALFAIEHHLWLAGLVAGIIFNLLYMWARNIWAPIAAHATANACLGVFILAYSRWDLW